MPESVSEFRHRKGDQLASNLMGVDRRDQRTLIFYRWLQKLDIVSRECFNSNWVTPLGVYRTALDFADYRDLDNINWNYIFRANNLGLNRAGVPFRKANTYYVNLLMLGEH